VPRERTAEILREEIIPGMRKQSPTNPNQLGEILERFDGASNAKCAIETAFFDAFGKQTGNSLSTLLGGSLTKTVKLNGWVGFGSPTEMSEQAAAKREEGFDSIKIKFSGDKAEDLARARAVCEAVGTEIEIRVDANEAYELDGAIAVAKELESLPIAHFEQPVPGENRKALSKLSDTTSLDIVADEALTDITAVRDALVDNICDRIKVKILRLGGILKTRMALDMAETFDVPCLLGHGFSLAPATVAEVQLAATHRNVLNGVEAVGTRKTAIEPFAPIPDMSNGRIDVSSANGFGVNIDGEYLSELTVRQETL
jgi:L-alanine-DL-glutamate epimerase-like enolase superfamily enzyme